MMRVKRVMRTTDMPSGRAEMRAVLLPFKSGCAGLNVVEATHVFLIEPLLNVAVEAQAIGRVHRIGQVLPLSQSLSLSLSFSFTQGAPVRAGQAHD